MARKKKSDPARGEQWVVPNPHDPWEGEARIRDTGVPVWALVGYLPAVGGDINRVAADYELPVEAVQAAVAYYQDHRTAIDVRLAQNAAFDTLAR